MAGKAKYRFTGEHAESLASGQMVEPGEFVMLSDKEADEDRNKELMAMGKLIGTGEKSEEQVEAAEKAVSRKQAKAEREEGSKE